MNVQDRIFSLLVTLRMNLHREGITLEGKLGRWEECSRAVEHGDTAGAETYQRISDRLLDKSAKMSNDLARADYIALSRIYGAVAKGMYHK